MDRGYHDRVLLPGMHDVCDYIAVRFQKILSWLSLYGDWVSL